MAAKVIPVPPHIDNQHMAEERVAFDRATQEFVANYDELLEQYPDQWIAVLMNPDEGRTVLSSADFDELCREIENRRLPLGRAYMGLYTLHGERATHLVPVEPFRGSPSNVTLTTHGGNAGVSPASFP